MHPAIRATVSRRPGHTKSDAHENRQRSDQVVAAYLKGESAGSPILGSHHLREAQSWSLGGERTSSGAPTERIVELVETSGGPAEIREHVDSGRRLNILGQSDLSFPCDSSGPEY